MNEYMEDLIMDRDRLNRDIGVTERVIDLVPPQFICKWFINFQIYKRVKDLHNGYHTVSITL